MLFKKIKKKARIIFFGTSDFSARILESIAAEHEVAEVITQPDKPVGRDHELTASHVAAVAGKLGLETRKPEKLKDNQKFDAHLRSLQPDLFIVAAYGKIIPAEFLKIPRLGSLNVHPSLLPKYRGPSPIQAALVNRERRTGVTIILMDEKMDHGPIVCQKSAFIKTYEFYRTLEQRLCEISKKLLLKAINQAIKGKMRPKPQNENKATYCRLLSREDGKIDWSMEVEDIFSRFRAYLGWPEIWTIFEGKRLIIKSCEPFYDIFDKEDGRHPGLVVERNEKICIACGKYKLEIFEIQLEGKSTVTVRSFLNGHKDFLGAVLPS